MTTTTTRPTARLLLAAGVIPLIVTGAGAVLLAAWRADLPPTIARHWSGGVPDGFASLGGMVALQTGLGVLFTVLTAALALSTRESATGRVVAGVGAGTTTFTVAAVVVSVAGQRGLADAAVARMSGWGIVLALVLGGVAGLIAAAVIPSWAAVSGYADGLVVEPMALADGERAVWSHGVSSGPMAVVLVGLPTVALVGVAVATQVWWVLAFVLLAMALAVALGRMRVVVDHHGVRVRGVLGWPRYHVALEDIARADVVHVDALRDFGGYGFRLSVRGPLKGSRGVVLRSGPALRVVTRSGSSRLVVVDDAETAAALVNGLLTRAAR